jgi:hypothetical protein
VPSAAADSSVCPSAEKQQHVTCHVARSPATYGAGFRSVPTRQPTYLVSLPSLRAAQCTARSHLAMPHDCTPRAAAMPHVARPRQNGPCGPFGFSSAAVLWLLVPAQQVCRRQERFRISTGRLSTVHSPAAGGLSGCPHTPEQPAARACARAPTGVLVSQVIVDWSPVCSK